jgi:hypothetical protein
MDSYKINKHLQPAPLSYGKLYRPCWTTPPNREIQLSKIIQKKWSIASQQTHCPLMRCCNTYPCSRSSAQVLCVKCMLAKSGEGETATKPYHEEHEDGAIYHPCCAGIVIATGESSSLETKQEKHSIAGLVPTAMYTWSNLQLERGASIHPHVSMQGKETMYQDTILCIHGSRSEPSLEPACNHWA